MRRGKHKDAVILKLIDARMNGQQIHLISYNPGYYSLHVAALPKMPLRASLSLAGPIFRWQVRDWEDDDLLPTRSRYDINFDEALAFVNRYWKHRSPVHFSDERRTRKKKYEQNIRNS